MHLRVDLTIASLTALPSPRLDRSQDAGLARNRRASASATTRPHRHPGPAPVSAIFNFGQDNRTEETQKTEEATAPDGEQSNNVTNGTNGPGGFFENAGAMFRSKSGGVGDVLEQNTGEASDKNYGGDVAGVSNDDPIDGVHRHPGPAPVSAIFNFGQDNRTEETQKTEEATAPDGEPVSYTHLTLPTTPYV